MTGVAIKGLMLRTRQRYAAYLLREQAKSLEEAQNGVAPLLDVNGALKELREKDENQIEYEAALTWAARAIASYTLAVQAGDKSTQTLRFTQGDDFRHEALEHSSQIEDGGKLLKYVFTETEPSRQQAFAIVVQPTWTPT